MNAAESNATRDSLLVDVPAPAAGRADALVDPLLGTQLGNYEILFVLGKGAYGVVYKARDVKLGRFVAIKFLHEFLDTQHEAMFLREAKAVAALAKHPSIVQIFEFNEFQGRNYFVLEFVGSSAAMLLRVHPKGLPQEQAARIVIDAAEGLHYAHRQEIVHRDVKPANILLEIEGARAKLADFGVARFFDPIAGVSNDGPGGTPAYMAPEVVAGASGDTRSDLFSLGVTYYELLCGALPFPGKSAAEVMDAIREYRHVPLRDRNHKLPDPVVEIVEQALARDPEQRFQSGDAFAAAVRGALAAPEDPLAPKRDGTTTDQVDRAKVRAFKAAEDARRVGAEKLANEALVEGVRAFRDGEAYEQLRHYGPALARYNAARAKLQEAEQQAGRILAEIRFLKTAQQNMLEARREAEAHDAARLAQAPFAAALRGEQTARQTAEIADATVLYAKACEFYKAATASAQKHAEAALVQPRANALAAREAARAKAAERYAAEELAAADQIFDAAVQQLPNHESAIRCYEAAAAHYAESARVAAERWRLEEEKDPRPPIVLAGIDFVWIPPGDFVMGSATGLREENPAHAVSISHGFWMAKHPVTQAQWSAIMDTNPSGFHGDAMRPVENVSWEDCQAFIAKLTETCEEVFRLPTEAEWEYACRAGSSGAWCFGDDPGLLDAYAWHPDNAGGRTHPVGQKRPNAWGLHDMHGNVCEWCEDDWHRDYENAPADGSPWRSEEAREKVTRGGSWCMLTAECRSASRDWRASPGTRTDFMGFRICKQK